MRKLCILSVIATILSGIAKIAGSAITTLTSSIISKFSGSAPVKGSGLFAGLSYAKDVVRYNVGKGIGTAISAPLSVLGKLLGVLGKLFIPLLIITIVLFVLMIVMRFLKKRRLRARIRKQVREEEEDYSPRHGSAVDVFSRLS